MVLCVDVALLVGLFVEKWKEPVLVNLMRGDETCRAAEVREIRNNDEKCEQKLSCSIGNFSGPCESSLKKIYMRLFSSTSTFG